MKLYTLMSDTKIVFKYFVQIIDRCVQEVYYF